VLTTPVLGFAKVVQDARVRINSYQQTGLFDSRYQGILRAGIQQDRVNDVIARVQARTSDLNAQVLNYKANRTLLANSTLQGMTNLGTQQSIIDQITQRLAQEKQISQDIAGLRQSIEVTEARYGDFMRAYNSMTTLNVDPGTTIQHVTRSVAVGPGDAVWPAPARVQLQGDLVTNFVVVKNGAPWKLPALKGDIVNVNTTGSWSPTCALRTHQFINPFTNAPDSINVPAGALTGPEGYLVSMTANSYTAKSNGFVHTHDDYSNAATTTSYCAGVTAGFGLGIDPIKVFSLGIFSFGAKAEAEWCRKHDVGTKIDDTTSASVSSGSESRMAAAFTTGVRVPNTPFPFFPAGSLLLLEVARIPPPSQPSRNDIFDVHVVQTPFSSFLIGADSDVYLVVNDIADPGCGAPDLRQLNLQINQVQPFGSLAKQLGNGMAQALTDLRAQQSLLLEQGRVGPQQMQFLRDQAFQDLSAACTTNPPCPLSAYPAEVLKFFETWVDKELATLERKVDVKSLERQIVLLDLQNQALSDDFNNAQGQARLLRLLPDWTLKDLDSQLPDLVKNTQSLLQLMIADLYPITDLKQPATLQGLDAATLNPLLGGPTTDWTGGLDTWTTATINASNNIVAKLRDALANSPPQNDLIVAVGFPNPANPPQAGQWQRVQPERARALWSSIAAKDAFATVSIQPSDIYDVLPGASNVLFCNVSAPVITAMAVYMVRPSAQEFFGGRFVPLAIDNNLNFPDAGQLKNYRLDNADWLNQQMAVLTGEAEDSQSGTIGMQHQFAAFAADTATPLYRVGNGLSPFTKFDIHLDGITTSPFGGPAPADGATELVLVFRVQARNVSGIHLAPMCP